MVPKSTDAESADAAEHRRVVTAGGQQHEGVPSRILKAEVLRQMKTGRRPSTASPRINPSAMTTGRIRIDGPTVMLEPNTAQAIAISLHELATNAAKYGSLSAADGDVEIAWSHMAGGQLSLRWTESGGPTIAPPTHRGCGTRIIENIVGGQLGAKVRFDWSAPGLTCEIALPLP
jgi:two-component sensor histidine kinase